MTTIAVMRHSITRLPRRLLIAMEHSREVETPWKQGNASICLSTFALSPTAKFNGLVLVVIVGNKSLSDEVLQLPPTTNERNLG
jgi:hypothetical protein